MEELFPKGKELSYKDTKLKQRIENRVKKMFDMGLREEVASLKKMGANLDWQSMKARGYREFFLDLQSDKEIFSLICSMVIPLSFAADA